MGSRMRLAAPRPGPATSSAHSRILTSAPPDRPRPARAGRAGGRAPPRTQGGAAAAAPARPGAAGAQPSARAGRPAHGRRPPGAPPAARAPAPGPRPPAARGAAEASALVMLLAAHANGQRSTDVFSCLPSRVTVACSHVAAALLSVAVPPTSPRGSMCTLTQQVQGCNQPHALDRACSRRKTCAASGFVARRV